MPYSNSIRETYPFLTKYFENGINSSDKNIAHCILFYGSDLEAQYNLALEIARMLNCKGTHTPECDCLNCRWIRENNHPAVLTVSKVDNKPADDTSKTVISITQARKIKNDLLVTSEYHRVYIFCDKDADGNIQGLNGINFQEDAANALLKTFEEPPSATTFFFLTKDKTDMITTVVSRAQSFFVPSMKAEDNSFEIVREAMEGYPSLERDGVLDLNDKLYALTGENEPLTVLTQVQNYIGALIKSNGLNTKLLHDFNAAETAKKQLQLNMNAQNVIENLAFELVLKG